jgi:hypothetical protein
MSLNASKLLVITPIGSCTISFLKLKTRSSSTEAVKYRQYKIKSSNLVLAALQH